MAGILDGLFSSGSGLLGNLGGGGNGWSNSADGYFQNNQNAMLGLASALMQPTLPGQFGANLSQGIQNYMQGAQTDLKQNQYKAGQKALQALAPTMKGLTPQMQAYMATQPELANAVISRIAAPNYTYQQGADGKTYAIDQNDPTNIKTLPIPGAKAANPLTPITIDRADGTKQTIGFQDMLGNRYSMDEVSKFFGPSAIQQPGLNKAGQDAIMTGKGKRVDELMAAGFAADQMGQQAKDTADFVKNSVSDNTIGGFSGGSFNRALGSLSGDWIGRGSEKERQQLEQRLNDLGLQFRKAVYTGTGQVSDKETQAAQSVLSSPASFDKETVIAAIQHMAKRAAYTQAFRDFYQQNAAQFGGDPDAAYAAFTKANPLPNSGQKSTSDPLGIR